ncbi:MAG: tripartite tricarboxylate transporter substrate binding protein [Rhodospirillales bacterium]|nr:tripartite tricarboxylate transporter substrate binding protein [Rhodospirillales bacterium]
MVTIGRRLALAGGLATLGLPQTARAQLGGGKIVRMIVPLSVGSGVDIVARILSEPLGAALGASVVVENLPGAGSITGTAQIVRGPKDGTMLGMISSNHVINPSVYKSIPYDALADITPISVVCTAGLVLVVNPSVPATNAKQLVAYARTQPEGMFYGSAGSGSVLHLAAEMFRTLGNVPLKHVPYRGTGPLLNDLVGGQVPMAFIAISAAAPQIASGKLRAIAVSTAERSPLLPEVPTLAEQGIAGFAYDAWIAMIGPAGLPSDVVTRVYDATMVALNRPDVLKSLRKQGLTKVGNSPQQATQLFAADLARHTKLAKEAGLTLE